MYLIEKQFTYGPSYHCQIRKSRKPIKFVVQIFTKFANQNSNTKYIEAQIFHGK